MGLRPLYLAHGSASQVIHDGRALRVQATGRAVAWYAYAKLSRVVSATDVQWQTAALLACLNAGVPVSFLDARGNVQGYCYGSLRRETTLDNLLAIALDAPDWESRFEFWYRGMHRQCMLRALATVGLPPRHLDHPPTVRSALCNAYHRHLGRPLAPLLRHLDGTLHAFAASVLRQHIDAQTLGHPRPGQSLVDAFATLLGWPAFHLLQPLDATRIDTTPPARLAAELLGDDSPLGHELDVLLMCFEHWLRGWAL